MATLASRLNPFKKKLGETTGVTPPTTTVTPKGDSGGLGSVLGGFADRLTAVPFSPTGSVQTPGLVAGPTGPRPSADVPQAPAGPQPVAGLDLQGMARTAADEQAVRQEEARQAREEVAVPTEIDLQAFARDAADRQAIRQQEARDARADVEPPIDTTSEGLLGLAGTAAGELLGEDVVDAEALQQARRETAQAGISSAIQSMNSRLAAGGALDSGTAAEIFAGIGFMNATQLANDLTKIASDAAITNRNASTEMIDALTKIGTAVQAGEQGDADRAMDEFFKAAGLDISMDNVRTNARRIGLPVDEDGNIDWTGKTIDEIELLSQEDLDDVKLMAGYNNLAAQALADGDARTYANYKGTEMKLLLGDAWTDEDTQDMIAALEDPNRSNLNEMENYFDTTTTVVGQNWVQSPLIDFVEGIGDPSQFQAVDDLGNPMTTSGPNPEPLYQVGDMVGTMNDFLAQFQRLRSNYTVDSGGKAAPSITIRTQEGGEGEGTGELGDLVGFVPDQLPSISVDELVSEFRRVDALDPGASINTITRGGVSYTPTQAQYKAALQEELAKRGVGT